MGRQCKGLCDGGGGRCEEDAYWAFLAEQQSLSSCDVGKGRHVFGARQEPGGWGAAGEGAERQPPGGRVLNAVLRSGLSPGEWVSVNRRRKWEVCRAGLHPSPLPLPHDAISGITICAGRGSVGLAKEGDLHIPESPSPWGSDFALAKCRIVGALEGGGEEEFIILRRLQ